MPSTVLIANRGEIAVRVIRACRQLGLRAVAVHSEADKGAMHVRLADLSIPIGPAAVAGSYLNIDAVIAAAKSAGAEMIHPGYGLLSENAEFAASVEAAGLTFVGPSSDTIALMGDKSKALGAARAAGLATLEGSGTVVETECDAAAVAETIGYPVMVKANFGGGGRGIRIARDAGELTAAIHSAKREGELAFGRSAVYLERCIERARHIEVQVLCDGFGNVVTLGERDCSIQRRHQKLLEEAPAPHLSEEMRSRLSTGTATLARQTGYRGAGTAEFLYDPRSDEAFFLEMNTRIQVEHGVTEMVTGVDLVVEQLRVAAGEPLSVTPDTAGIRGHAIEARILAEDPWNDFRPAPGRISAMKCPGGPFVRADFGVETGDEISVHYDSMLGKLLAFGSTRDAAIKRLDTALAEFSATGVKTTAPFLRAVLSQETFRLGRYDTGSVERDWSNLPEIASADEPAGEALQTGLAGPGERWVAIETSEGIIELALPTANTARADGEEVAFKGEKRTARSRDRVDRTDPVAPLDCTIASIHVTPGDKVEADALLAVLESMKMELPIRAERRSLVRDVPVEVGQSVRSGTVVVHLEDLDDDGTMATARARAPADES